MQVEIRESGREVFDEVRRSAEAAGCNLRIPHWSVSQAGLIGELAIAAGGILVLDDVEEFRLSTLQALRNTLSMMQDSERPVLFLTHRGEMTEPTERLAEALRALPGAEEDDRRTLEAARRTVLDAGVPADGCEVDRWCSVTRTGAGTWAQVWVRLPGPEPARRVNVWTDEAT